MLFQFAKGKELRRRIIEGCQLNEENEMKVSMNKIPIVEKGQVVVIKVPGRYNEDRILRRAESIRNKLVMRDGCDDVKVFIEISHAEPSVKVMDAMDYQNLLGEETYIDEFQISDDPEEDFDIELTEETDEEIG